GVGRRLPEEVYAGTACPVELEVRVPAAVRRGVLLEDVGPDHELAWFLPRLAGPVPLWLRQDVVLPRRGRYLWGEVTVASAYPFGLIGWGKGVAPGLEGRAVPRGGRLDGNRF